MLKITIPKHEAVTRRFERKVITLAQEAHELASTYAALCQKMLHFADKLHTLMSEARKLDNDDDGAHQVYLRRALQDAVGSANPAVLSKWNTIGSQASLLIPFKDAIPPQRECLYELALAAKQGKPIERWVETQRLHPNSTVRDVMTLRRPKKQKRRQKDHLATVALRFSTYDEAAETLLSLMRSRADFLVGSHPAFKDALKAKLSKSDYEKIQERFQ